MDKRWILKEIPAHEQIEELSKAININSYLVMQFLLQRGITDFETARNFFALRWMHFTIHFLMKGMEQAVRD